MPRPASSGLLSLFNMAGRFGWSSLSDRIGRKATYACFFTLGPLLYLALPYAGRIGSVALFVGCAALILTMYGGGFATIPAYLSDLFGTHYVGAIHGRLLTAWSAAGVAGPVLVNYIREYQIDRGVPVAQAYNVTMYLMAGLLVLGFFCQPLRPTGARALLHVGGGAHPRAGNRGRTALAADCIKSPSPEYCYETEAGARRSDSFQGRPSGSGQSLRRQRVRPMGSGRGSVGAGWSSAALGRLEHAAQGGRAVPLRGDVQNLTLARTSAMHCIA